MNQALLEARQLRVSDRRQGHHRPPQPRPGSRRAAGHPRPQRGRQVDPALHPGRAAQAGGRCCAAGGRGCSAAPSAPGGAAPGLAGSIPDRSVWFDRAGNSPDRPPPPPRPLGLGIDTRCRTGPQALQAVGLAGHGRAAGAYAVRRRAPTPGPSPRCLPRRHRSTYWMNRLSHLDLNHQMAVLELVCRSGPRLRRRRHHGAARSGAGPSLLRPGAAGLWRRPDPPGPGRRHPDGGDAVRSLWLWPAAD